MKKPNRYEFSEETKIDGKLIKVINELKYRIAMKKWDLFLRDKHKHTRLVG